MFLNNNLNGFRVWLDLHDDGQSTHGTMVVNINHHVTEPDQQQILARADGYIGLNTPSWSEDEQKQIFWSRPVWATEIINSD